jgi:hypothetical protein
LAISRLTVAAPVRYFRSGVAKCRAAARRIQEPHRAPCVAALTGGSERGCGEAAEVAIGCYLKRKRRLSEGVNPEGRALGEQTSAILADCACCVCACCVRDRRIYGANIRIVPGRPARPCKTPQFAPRAGAVLLGKEKTRRRDRRASQYCGLRRLSSVAIEASFGGKLVNSETARAN